MRNSWRAERWVLLLALGSPAAAQIYAGASACAECHATESAVQTHSHHAQALRPMEGSPLSSALLAAGMSPDATVQYNAAPGGVQAQSDAQHSLLLNWAFGAGAQGMTAVSALTGEPATEHRFSRYTRPSRLALTFGHPARASSPSAQLGVRQDARTIGRCFGCHAIVQDSVLETGIRCERCHGPGVAHIQAVRSGQAEHVVRTALVNPGRLPATAQVQFCGACHRLPGADDGEEPELQDPVSVRFAPVGLMASRCFRKSKTLSCLTCHNPHENARLATELSYRDRCLTCHTDSAASVKLCRRVQHENCVPCHMGKVALGPNLQFTNHRIH